ncbi:MAG: AAA family ATPase [Deinococcales bacterium]
MTEPQLRIELLGHLRILHGGEPVAGLTSNRRRALLAHLALQCRAGIDRRQLAYLFWPDSEESQARTNLRREFHHLRNELPQVDEVIDLGAEVLSWKVGDLAITDVAAFEDALSDADVAKERGARPAERRALARAAELYRGDLLPALYDDWAERERQRLRARALAAVKRLVDLCEAAGDMASAVDYAERRIRIDPLDETAYRRLLHLHQRAGNRAAAINAFHRCAGVLQRELDLAPSQATRDAYEALLEADTGPGSPATPMETREAVPLIGRGEALSHLADAWRHARDRGPQVAMVLGEAGIGKTRLVEEFVRICQQQGASVVHGRAYAAERRFSYGLAVAWLRNAVVTERLQELPPAWRSEVARLAPELDAPAPERSEPADTVPASWQRRRLLEAVARAVLSAPPPVLLVADDLQWADPDSLDTLHLLTHLDETAALLVVATARTEELPGNLPLERLLLRLRAEGLLRDVELGPLNETDTASLARQVAGTPVEGDALARLQRVSEGVPLFVVESVRVNVAADAKLAAPASHEQVPPRVRAVLAARLRQLSRNALQLAEVAATIGRAFRFETLRLASDLTEEILVASLDELWRRRIVLENTSAGYDFSHDILRDAAYETIDPARRSLLHRRVARALELVHAGDTGPVSARLAQHYELGGEIWRAVAAYRNAAQEAARLYSHQEALRLLDRALSLLDGLPASEERERRELELQLARIIPARSLGGYTAPVLATAAERSADIARRHHDMGALYHALRSLQTTRFVSGDLARALELSEQLQALARDVPERQAEGDHAMAGLLLTRGDLPGALEQFAKAERSYDPVTARASLSVFGADLAVFTAAWQAHAQWLAGLHDRAHVSSRRAVQLANELDVTGAPA